ncbi:MAG TPA: P-loop NTPase fold protein, partial [Solirubrobacterales bacterium]|nr:P-loop NTPase fold protein [Solirubrobacterales bacterium]
LDDGSPASQRLRAWYKTYEDDFNRFFPDQHRRELPDQLDWDDSDPSQVWERLKRVSTQFGNARDRRPDTVAFFVLLRDNMEALGPVFHTLNVEPDSVPEAAFDEIADGGVRGAPLAEVFTQYEELREVDQLPDGPGLAFLAFVYSGKTGVTDSLQQQWTHGHLVAAVRAASVTEQGSRVLNIQKRATPDLPADKDELGVLPLVEGLRALLDDKDTNLPLAIGVNAPWGAGKSSVMLQLCNALVDNETGNRTWTPVRFDAWKYEHSERLWAALGKAIYEQPREHWSWWNWAKFKMRLELRRRSGRDSVLRVAVLGLLLIGSILAISLQGLTLPALGGVALFLAGFGETIGRAWGLVGDPFKRVLEQHADRPKYERYLGFTSEADADIRLMTEELTRQPNHALLVLVDDLDRCSPRHIVEVVEAINQIFNSNEKAECAFVLGMDRDMVAAGIEVAYADTILKLPKARQSHFGLAFLAKLVQISVSVPRPGEEAIERLLLSITDWGSSPTRGPEGDRVEDMQLRISSARPANPADVQDVADAIAHREALSDDSRLALDEAVRLERAKLFDCDSTDVQEAERRLVRYLDRNPREIKRFDNAFRLQLHVANGTKGCGLRFDLDDLIALGKSIVLRLRWPDLGDAIDQDDQLLQRLEDASNGGAGAPLGESAARWAKDEGLCELLRGDRLQRPSRLAEHTILRVS